MGADVVKIERPGRGDDARAWAPPWWGDQSATFLAFNRNKRSLALDLKTAAGRAVLKRLAARVDGFLQSPSAEGTRELGGEFVGGSGMNSRLVYCAMIAPYQAFPAADGYVMIAAGSDALFVRLARALDAPGLADDTRFADNPRRVQNRAVLVEANSALTRARKSADLIETLRRHDVPCSPILTIDRVLEEPQTRESGMLLRPDNARLPDFTCVGLPIRWDGRRPGVRRAPPRLGEPREAGL